MVSGSSGTRGQAYTLEGIVAAILVVSSLLLALQAVVITPTTEGTADRDTMSQLDTQADDVLAAAHERGALANATLHWNATSENFTESWGFSDCPDKNVDGQPLLLCEMLEETFTERSYRYNVHVDFRNGSSVETEELFDQGVPNSNAVSATHAVTLHGGMNLTGPHDRSLSSLGGNFSVPTIDAGGIELYVVEIRVVVW